LEGKADAVETAIGNLPTKGAIDINGVKVSDEDLEHILEVDKEAWLAEIESIRENYVSYGDRLPAGLVSELDKMEEKLKAM
jgi:phosphoenolpyruvate carboxykinase (GTP)